MPSPLPGAHCLIPVDEVGTLDMEDDYLPHVIQCENGGANLEALKAQAIAARSVAYYAIETSGSICDSQACQVYGCGAEPLPIHYQAVEQTAGQYLAFNDTLTYGFYVAGDSNTAPPACVGVSGATEGWVTYNEGRSGTEVEQTELGFVHAPGDPGYGQNRGCMSQWGARCLENDNGYDHRAILRFYYGEDIEVVQAFGECVGTEPGGESDSTFGEATSQGDTGADTRGDDSGGSRPADTGGGRPTGPGPGGDDLPVPGGTEGGLRPTGGSDPALPPTFGATPDERGCACRATPVEHGAPDWRWLAGLGLLLRRRRRTAVG